MNIKRAMNSKIKSKILFLPKIIIFGLALFDFLYIHSHIPARDLKTIVEFPYWYERSTSDLWLLLTAAICLVIGKRGSYIMSIILSGYIVIYGLILFNRRSITLFEVWKYVRENELNLFLQWELQFFFAVTIFVTTVFYLVGSEYLRDKTSIEK